LFPVFFAFFISAENVSGRFGGRTQQVFAQPADGGVFFGQRLAEALDGLGKALQQFIVAILQLALFDALLKTLELLAGDFKLFGSFYRHSTSLNRRCRG
jgi:hypothetical protein